MIAAVAGFALRRMLAAWQAGCCIFRANATMGGALNWRAPRTIGSLGIALLLTLAAAVWCSRAPAAPAGAAQPVGPAAGSTAPGDEANAGSQRVEQPPAAVVAGDDGQRSVFVVDGSGAPVAGAEVHWCAAPAVRDASRDVESSVPADQVAAASDVHGEALFRSTAGQLLVMARHGASYGERVVDFADWTVQRRELVLDEDRTLRVRVVDDVGIPQPEVEVALWLLQQPADEYEAWQQQYEPLRSDAAGNLVVPHLQTRTFWPRDGKRWLRLSVRMLGVQPPPLDVALEDLTREPVLLHCPAHGQIRVRLWQRPGVPSQLWTDLLVWSSAEADASEQCPMVEAGPEVRTLRAPLGRDWWMNPPGAARTFVPGPKVAGEVVSIDLSEAPTGTCVVHLQDVDGKALANADVLIVVGEVLHGLSDAQGRVCFEPYPDHRRRRSIRNVEWRGEVKLVVGCVPGFAGGRAELQLPEGRPEALSEVDLGIVRVTADVVLASGRVVDDSSGLPVKARIWAFELPSLLDVGSANTDQDGRFELRGRPGARLQLCWMADTQREHYERSYCEVAAGARDLVLRLQRSGSLCVEVLHDAAIRSERWSLDVWRDGEERATPTERERSPGRVRFVSDSLQPGTYHVALRLMQNGPPLVQIDDLVLRAGELPQDPRLSIDLQGKLTDARLRVHVAGSTQPGPGNAFLHWGAGKDDWCVLSFLGELRLALPAGREYDAILLTDDGLPQRVRVRAGDALVETQTRPSLRVTVPGLPAAVPSERLRLQLYCLERSEPLYDELAAAGFAEWSDFEFLAPHAAVPGLQSHQDEDRAAFAAEADVADGAAVLPADARGRYAVVLQVKGEDGDWRSVYGRPMQFEVGTGGEQVVVLEVDPEQVRALLQTGKK